MPKANFNEYPDEFFNGDGTITINGFQLEIKPKYPDYRYVYLKSKDAYHNIFSIKGYFKDTYYIQLNKRKNDFLYIVPVYESFINSSSKRKWFNANVLDARFKIIKILNAEETMATNEKQLKIWAYKYMPYSLLKFLLEEKVLSKFVHNLIKFWNTRDVCEKGIANMLRTAHPIDKSFCWGDTEQGYYFWVRLNNKFDAAL